MLIRKTNTTLILLTAFISVANAHNSAKYHDLPASEISKHMVVKLQEGLKGESWQNFANHPAFGVFDIQVKNPQAKLNVFQKIEQGKLYRGLENGMAQFYRYRNKHRFRGANNALLNDSFFQAPPILRSKQSFDPTQAITIFNFRSHALHQVQWKNNELAPVAQTTSCLAAYYKNLFVRE